MIDPEYIKRFKDTFGRPLKEAGFVRKASTWYAHGPECIRVVNLQRSQWGPQYYINLAIWLNVLGENRWPKEYQCHVRTRADSIAPDPAVLKALLDLEDTGTSPDERCERLAEFVGAVIVPFLAQVQDLAGLKAIVAENAGRRLCVLKIARDLLGLRDE